MTAPVRLTPMDRTFLDVESAEHPQHVGATLIFPVAPLRNAEGGVDAARIRAHIAARLHRVPRYRQKLAWIPIERHPVWIDDESFQIRYHVRHTSLPRPGDARQLKRLAARVMSQRLDRSRPLWEVWVVEGLADDRFALLTKTHHCMIDGIAGVDLMGVLLSPSPDEEVEPPVRWVPDRPPGALELARAALGHRLALPARATRGIAHALRRPRDAAERVREQLAALAEVAGAGLNPASDTPLNRPIGPHRRFDWTQFDLGVVKAVKDRLGGTVNDVVLATVAGALGSFLGQRGVTRHAQQRMDLRAMVPVSVRSAADRGMTGNRIALWAVPLPVSELDPRARLGAVREITAGLKRSKQALGAEVLAAVSEWTVPTILSIATRVAYRSRAANLVVTNVPGPQIPLYLLGARLLEAYPMLNLLIEQGLGVALFSYDGRLGWGLMADWDLVPDLHDFVIAIEQAFQELCEVAGLDAAAPHEAPEQTRRGAEGARPPV